MKKIIFKLLSTVIFLSLCTITNAQIVSTLAGSTTHGSNDGTGTAASFYQPHSVATDGNGNLYVADGWNHKIRKIVISTGVVTTLAGSTTPGSNNGTGTAASFYYPRGVISDGSNVYVADEGNNEIRKIVISTGVVTTLAGSTISGSNDGTGTAASFNDPWGVATDGSGNLYVADTYNNKIRKIVISTGVVTTLAGSTTPGSNNGTGTAASFSYPYGVGTDQSGNVYVADFNNNEIRKIVASTGVVTTLAGSITSGSANGTGTAASFNLPQGVVFDGNGNLYIGDAANNEIRKIVISTGAVTTLAGATTAGYTNGTGTAASFTNPTGVAMDANGNIYVADQFNHEIRMITGVPAGITELNATSSDVLLYPNPSTGKFTIEEHGLTTTGSIEIYNITGEKIYTETLNPRSTSIDISNKAEGIYFYRIISETGNLVSDGKFVIQK